MSVLVWSSKDIGASAGNWVGLTVAGTDLYVVENPHSGVFADPVIVSTNGGTSWSAGTTNVNFRPQVSAYNGSNTIVVVGNGLSSGTGRETFRRAAGVWGAGGAMPSPAAIWLGVAWNGTNFAACKDGGAATSADGTAWTGRTCAIVGSSQIAAHGTKFIIVGQGDSNCYVSSDNGATWVSHAMTSSGWTDVASNGSRIVACGLDKIAYSDDDGSTWTEVPVAGSWYAIENNGSMFCMIGTGGKFSTSTTGGGWTTDNLPSGANPVSYAAIGVLSGNFIFLGSRTGSPFYATWTSAPGFVEFWRNEKNCEEIDA